MYDKEEAHEDCVLDYGGSLGHYRRFREICYVSEYSTWWVLIFAV